MPRGVLAGIVFTIAIGMIDVAGLRSIRRESPGELPATPGKDTQNGVVVYRFGADLFYANINHFADEVLSLVEQAPTPIRWFVIDASAVTDIDYSAAQKLYDLLDELAHRQVSVLFARVSPYLRADMDRHRITDTVGADRVFGTLHEAIARAIENSSTADAARSKDR